ncbi:peptidoglycan editing factor PgeF, partial [Basilea psittacipulmonis]
MSDINRVWANWTIKQASCFTTKRYGPQECVQEPATENDFAGFNMGWHSGDQIERISSHYQKLEAELGVPICLVKQVHGHHVFDVDKEKGQFTYDWATRPEADAMVTTRKDVALGILTADCLPIALASQDCIGMVHAGWRGLAAGVLENTLDLMKQKSADTLIDAWVGPAISQSCFEVGEDVYDAFVKENREYHLYFKKHPDVKDKFYADLVGIAKHKILTHVSSRVFLSDLCTYQDPQFYSWR